MKNDMKKRILSAQLVLILLMILWCGTCFESKESQRQMEQSDASQSESGASNAVEVKRKLMYKVMDRLENILRQSRIHLVRLQEQIIRISRWEIRTKTMRIRDI